MKNKKRFIPVIVLTALVLLLAIYFGSPVRVLRLATGANDPALVSGHRIFITRIGKPKRRDFIAYKQAASPHWSAGTWVMRVCGMPGDTIEIKDGVLYVNHQNADTMMNLKQEYIVPSKELLKISPDFYQTHSEEIAPAKNDSSDATLETDLYKNNHIRGRQVIVASIDSQVQAVFHQSWTVDYFGPIVVPPNGYFVLGDNRHGAADSRYTGFIKTDQVIGTVFYGERKY